MTPPMSQTTPIAPDLAELLRESLAGVTPNDLLAAILDRLEGRP